ncbi:MAG: 16S rRNA (uracil(1498)-N(3))-methyltransferase [Phyllobacteriaceae bacterium]|nr:16S rRNA (uracil(1498)-N(3))-methyltransferase [Phyllobacteriaceae bacterium]
MILFYTTEINNDIAVFPDDEARHCVQVLRKKSGDEIRFTDGKGNWYDGQILTANKRELTARILRNWPEDTAPPPIHLAVAPTKNIERFEWFLEKATEFGISEITPIVCEHSERKKLRPERLERILVAAMKQSLRATKPVLNELLPFESLLKQPELPLQRFIAHCHSGDLPHLMGAVKPGMETLILIGPEGDFSDAEVQAAVAGGFKAISLGTARLRTETAAIAACHIANLVFSGAGADPA